MVEEKTLEVATKSGRQGCKKDTGDQEGVVRVGVCRKRTKKEVISRRHYERVLRSK